MQSSTLKCWMVLCGLLVSLTAPVVADSVTPRIAVFHLNGPLLEKPEANLGLSLGKEPTTLRELVDRFEKVKNDPAIRAVLVTIGQPSMGLAQIEELRQAMRSVGKPVYAHIDSLDTGLYALVSGAKHVSVTPTGDVWLLGFYMESMYLRGMLDKIHVEPDFVHIGAYKSAGEALSRKGPSDEAKANVDWLLDGLYGSLVKMIADSRYYGDEEKVRRLINDAPYTAESALDAGLIDSVKHRQDLVAELKAKYGDELKFVHNYGRKAGPEVDLSNPFALFQMFSELMSDSKVASGKKEIAVVHVNGVIMPGADDPSPFGGSSGARSTTIRKALDEAAASASVRAVVLRVDSPGGSALASEIIYDATQRIRAKGKPVVVSMGNVAASGGYYVSCGADHIIADPTTITASIGVVGGKLVTTGLWDWMGVNWHAYQRGDAAALMSTARKWNEHERGVILAWMEEVYGIFKGHILEHREEKLSKPLEDIAGGRVFTGAQAFDLGLVDGLGTFADAVEKAADLASIADYDLRVLPKPKTLFDWFRESVGGQETDSAQYVRTPAFAGAPLFETVLPALRTLDPQRAKVLVQALLRLQLIHSEQVIVMSPEDWLIRFR